ncbi:MAG: type III secretion protein [Polaromonas sp.]|nr:type III secretion protein [Polaromonas sp.]
MSFFKELLSIKAFRENKAELNVGKQRVVHGEAVAAHLASEQALLSFQDYAQQHERSLYADLCKRIVKLRAIEEVQLEVVFLRDQEQSHHKTVASAELEKQAQEQRLADLRRVHKDATKAKEKFVELAQVYADEKSKEFERKEDAELEEVAELRRDRTEWDESHEEVA